jgi:toxin co-regulated pilin
MKSLGKRINRANAIRRNGAATSKERGIALLELIIAIGILGVLSAGIVVLSSRTFASMNLKETVDRTSQLRVGIIETFRTAGSYNAIGTTEAALLATGAVRADQLKNPLGGGNLQVRSVTLNGKPDGGFVIAVGGFDADQCVKFVTQIGTSYVDMRVLAGGSAVPATINDGPPAGSIIYAQSNTTVLADPTAVRTACTVANPMVTLGSA